jgi:hypothetical protein
MQKTKLGACMYVGLSAYVHQNNLDSKARYVVSGLQSQTKGLNQHRSYIYIYIIKRYMMLVEWSTWYKRDRPVTLFLKGHILSIRFIYPTSTSETCTLYNINTKKTNTKKDTLIIGYMMIRVREKILDNAWFTWLEFGSLTKDKRDNFLLNKFVTVKIYPSRT